MHVCIRNRPKGPKGTSTFLPTRNVCWKRQLVLADHSVLGLTLTHLKRLLHRLARWLIYYKFRIGNLSRSIKIISRKNISNYIINTHCFPSFIHSYIHSFFIHSFIHLLICSHRFKSSIRSATVTSMLHVTVQSPCNLETMSLSLTVASVHRAGYSCLRWYAPG